MTPARLYMQTYLEQFFFLFALLEYTVTSYLVPKELFLLNIQWLLLCYTYAKVAFCCCCHHSAAAACQHPFINYDSYK